MRCLLASLLLMTACSGAGLPVSLQGEATIAGSSMGGALTVFPPIGGLAGLDFSAVPEMSSKGITRQQVRSATVQSASIRVLSPEDRDFMFLDSLQLVARSGDTETVFAEKLEIGSLPLGAPNPSFKLDVVSADISRQVAGATVSVVMRGKGLAPMRDVRLQVNVDVRVDAEMK